MNAKNFIRTDGKHNVLHLHLTVLVFQQEEYYVSFCPALQLSSYGDSVQEAKNGFDDVMKDYIEEGTKKGTLHDDLVSHGWVFSVIHNQNKIEPPAKVELNIPAGLLKTQFSEKWDVPVH